MNDSLTLLTKKEEMNANERFTQFCQYIFFKSYIKHTKNKILDFFAKIFWANHSFAHFLWATWANRSWLLICLERPERFAHGCSFPMSNLSNSLIAHLSWAIWANRSQSLIWFEQNEQMSDEQMSEFPALSILQQRGGGLATLWGFFDSAHVWQPCTRSANSPLFHNLHSAGIVSKFLTLLMDDDLI